MNFSINYNYQIFLVELSAVQRAFAKSLKEFKFTVVGNNQTDDERKISKV